MGNLINRDTFKSKEYMQWLFSILGGVVGIMDDKGIGTYKDALNLYKEYNEQMEYYFKSGKSFIFGIDFLIAKYMEENNG